jgi:phosphotriesterase-related protein
MAPAEKAEGTAYVQTVRGPVDSASLGRTLMHEHLVNINAEIGRDQPEMSWGRGRDAVVDSVVTEIQQMVDSGIDSIVDATAIGHGREIATVQLVNERVDLNIVVATGLYTYDGLPFMFAHQVPAEGDRDLLTEVFVRDITSGIARTGVKAGIIKCVTDLAGVTPDVDRVLRAAAAAQRETGVAITTHSRPHEHNGLAQQRVFADEGVDLRRVVIGHSGDTTDVDYLRELMDAGSTIGSDRFGLYRPGYATLEERVRTIVRLCELGYADRIVLAHDYTPYSDWFPGGVVRNRPPQWTQSHIMNDVVPALLEAGLEQAQVDQMLVGNPRRLLEVSRGS